MAHTREAAMAITTPPSCVSGFRLRALPAGDLDLAAEFKLSCATCGSDVFQILAFPLLITDPSEYYGFAAGETFHRPPHRLRCTSCVAETALFDGRTQGYDGVLNGGYAAYSGDDGEAAIPGNFRVTVAFLYNIELEELATLAAEAHVNPSDLFDAFGIIGTPVDGGAEITLDYECA